MTEPPGGSDPSAASADSSAATIDELAHVRALLAAIVVSSEDAIASKNLDGIVTSWNQAAERLFGYSAEEMIGQSILRIIPTELHGEEADILAKLRAGDRVERFETTRLTKTGERVE